MTLTPLTFEPSPDRLAFESRKYSHRGLWLLLLPSGRVGVANSRRELVAIIDPGLWPLFYELLTEADSAPAPESDPPTRPRSLSFDLDDLDLRI